MSQATIQMLGAFTKPDNSVFWDRVGNQITASNEIGENGCFVISDGGSDVGLRGCFTLPKGYTENAPKIRIGGILDGAMSSVTLQFGIQGISPADNAGVDSAYCTEDTGNNTTDHADEDQIFVEITLSNFTGFSELETVYFKFFIDASGNTYAGNFLLTSLIFYDT